MTTLAVEGKRPRRWRWPLIASVAILVVAALIRLGPATDAGRALIERSLNGLDLGSLGRLRVSGLAGDPWSHPRIGRLTLTDRTGVWLEARGVDLDWRASDLIGRRVNVHRLAAQQLILDHRPNAPATQGASGQLPVSVSIDRLTARVEMNPAFAGRPGDYDLSGSLDLDRAGAARAALSAASRLHPGDRMDAHLDWERDKFFAVTADAHEAQGGALAGSLGFASDQPFLLTIRAKGSLHQGQVFVDSHVGQVSPFQAQGSWTPAGGEVHGVIELASSSLLSGYRAMAGPEARFDVAGRRASDGLPDLTISAKSDNINLAAHGEADAGAMTTGPKGMAIDLRIARADRLTKFPAVGAAAFEGTLIADRSHWRLAGAGAATNVSEAGYTLARVAGPLSLEPRGKDLVIVTAPSGDGGAGQGLLAALLGARPRASAQIMRLADGRLLMEQLSVDGVGLKAQGQGQRGLLGGLTFNGMASFSNLALAHRGATGVVDFSWTASQSGANPWLFSADSRGRNLASGMDDVDRLLGRTPHLVGHASWAGNVLTVADSTLTGVGGQVSGTGTLGGDGALGLKLLWTAKGPLDLGPMEVAGTAKGTGGLTGSLTDPRLDLLADLGAVNAPGLALANAHLALTFQHAANGGDGRFALNATSAYGPAAAESEFRFAGDGLDLTHLGLTAGGLIARGDLALRRGEPSSADLTLTLGPGAWLTAGHAQGRVKIVDAPGGARADISLEGGEAIFEGVEVKALKFAASGPFARLPYKIAANGPSAAGPWRVSGAGEIAETGGERTASFAGLAHLRRSDFRTLTPAELRFGDKGLAAHAEVGVGSGHALVDFSNAGGEASLKASLADIDMALLDNDYVGKLSGQLSLAGRGHSLEGGLDARLSGAGGRDLRGAPPVNGEVVARLRGGAMNVRFDLGNNAGLKANGDVSVPVTATADPFAINVESRRPLAGRFAIHGEIKPVWDLVMTGAENLSGQVNADVTLGGTLADPSMTGQVAIDGGRLQDQDTGFALQNVTLRAALAGNAIDVSQFTAVDGAKGRISGSGRANLARDGVSSFRADLTGFRLIDTDLARATASGPLTIDRAADGKVRIVGTLTLDDAQVSPNPPQASGVTPMDVVEIHRPDELDDEPAVNTKVTQREAPIGLDVTLRAPGRVYLKGRGLNMEMSFDARVAGTVAEPVLTGNARVVRGDYNFAGQRFLLDDRSVVYLASTPQAMRLDLTATREDPSLTATIKISGTAAKPVIILSSSPALPQDEILSQVLFGASASQLSGLEAAQLASAVAGLSGGGGFDLIGGLRSLAHLDRLAIADSTVTGTTVSGGKYITDRLYLQLTGGGREGQQAQLEWRVRKRLSLVGKLGSQGDSQIAIRWRRSY
ncbi:MAG TPA: translocation/assembly module TamB domain-containing protein [Caulobacteraceae bacterium]|nr:translocation/assembly module TamB domain-containing protein [Caulobacteraceae bacterium]